ncbi:MAG: hypothetical protein J6M12_07990 [Clostridia bacterium]|nr:hypothetical protein [Clostridia bacterium]
MAQDNKDKKDLSPDELLKKLLTSFGGSDPAEEDHDQLTIDDAAREEKKKNRPKIFRMKAKEETKESAPSAEEGEDRLDKEALEEQIRKAELFVASMNEKKDEKRSDEPSEDAEKPSEREEKVELEEKEEDEELSSIFSLDFPEVEEGPHAGKDRGSDPFAEESSKEEEIKTQDAQEESVNEEADAEESFKEEENAPLKEETFDVDEETVEQERPLTFEDLTEEAEETTALEQLEEPEEEDEGEVSKEDEEPLESEEDGDEHSEPIDEKEIGIMMLFGDKKKLEDTVGKEEAARRERSVRGDAGAEAVKEEYLSPDQNARFFKMLRGAYTRLNIRAILAVIAFIAVLLLEWALPMWVDRVGTLEGVVGAGIAGIFENPVLTALAGLQVTFLLAAVAYKEFGAGLKAFVTGRSVPQMFLTVSVIFTVVYEIALLFCRNVSAPFYNLPVALMALLAVLFTGMNVSRTILTFKVISSKRRKFAVTHRVQEAASLEKEAFEQYLSESTGVFGVGQTDFVKNFAKRSAREPRYKSVVVILATVCTVLGVIFFLLGYYFAPEARLLSGLVMALQAVLFAAPASAFVTYALPFFRASKKAFAVDSAIVGEFSLEEYADATVISFDDKEVFPAKNVKVRSLKLFGDTRIDHVLFGAASVFHRVGGPLDDVFGVATKESGYSDKVDLLEVVPGGVEAAVDGELVRVGNAAFMRSKGLLASVDPDDTALEMEGRLCVMYMSIGDKLAAKMYVEYTADKEIEEIMASLYKAGMCIGIRTLDPNIDDRMISCHVDLSKYPVKVLRMDRKEKELYAQEMESGVVSKRNVKSLLRTLTFCRKVLQVIRVGTVIKVIGMLVGVVAAALVLFLTATGRLAGVYDVSSIWIMIYQLCWILPTFLISLIFV